MAVQQKLAEHDPFLSICLNGKARDVLREIQNLVPFDRFDFLNRRDEAGNTVLHLICEKQNPESLETLLDFGADANVYNNEKNSPLHVCGSKNEMKMAKILIFHGAKIDAKNAKEQNVWQMVDDGFDRKRMEKHVKLQYKNFLKKIKGKFTIYPEARLFAEYKAAFDLFDVDSSGFIDKSEMKQVMSALLADEPTFEEVEEFFSWIDADKDGKVSFEEYLIAMVKNLHAPEKGKKSKKKNNLRKNRQKKMKNRRGK